MTFVTTVASIAASELVAPKLRISGGSLNFTIEPSVTGRNYQLQESDGMVPGTWQNLGPEHIGDGGPLVVTVPCEPAARRRFYRFALR